MQCPGIGAVRMRQLCSAVAEPPGGLKEPWRWSLPRLQKAFGWPEQVLCSFDRYRTSLGLQPCLEVPSHVLLPCDPGWPAGFENLERPPLSIQWRGTRGLLPLLSSQQAIAVVGTRRPSSHGLRMAAGLGRALARARWPVVSGLAEGIDAAAHRACLESGGQTVAVLGTPLHRVYPPEHRQLQQAIADAGLLITEFRDSERVSRSCFARRNRLLAAVTKAVVVVECPQNSGALRTAAMARSMDIPVWVVPGDALRDSAQGSNALLGSVAEPLINPQDLIQQLGPGPCLPGSHADPGLAEDDGNTMPCTPVQVRLLKLLNDDFSFDEMVQSLQSNPENIASELLKLELAGRVKAQPGLRWRTL